jgi:hypothetical protein
MLTVYGRGPAAMLAATIEEVSGVASVASDDSNIADD